MKTTSMLAEAAGLSRKVHPQGGKEDFSFAVEVTKGERTELYYYFYTKDEDRNSAMKDALKQATFEFLGLTQESTEVSEPAEPAKPAKKKPTKKAATKKAATKKKPEPVVEEPSDDLDGFDLEDAIEAEPEATVNYDKTLKDHAAVFSPVIVEVLGEDWKKDESAKTKVRKTIAVIHGKEPVMTESGVVLDSFISKCRELLG